MKHEFPKFAEVDLARLAAFIDGEGCISVKQNGQGRWGNGRQHILRLVIANTDIRLVSWLTSTFGVGCVYRRKRSSWTKSLHYWELNGKKAAHLISECYPFLLIKKEQADIALAFQSLLNHQNDGRGAKLSLEEINKRDELKSRLSLLKKMERPQEAVNA